MLAEKRAHLQELGIDSALDKFSAMMDQKSLVNLWQLNGK